MCALSHVPPVPPRAIEVREGDGGFFISKLFAYFMEYRIDDSLFVIVRSPAAGTYHGHGVRARASA